MLGTKLLTLALGAATTVLVARALGPNGRGTVYVALGFMLILSQIGTLGIAAANTYFVARDPAVTRRAALHSLVAAGVVGGALVLAGAAVVALFPGALPGLSNLDLALALAAVPPWLAAIYLRGILLGLGLTISYNAVEGAQALLTLAALTVAFAAFDVGPSGALAVMTAGFYFAAITYAAAVMLRAGRVDRPPDPQPARDLLSYSAKIYVASLAAFLLLRLDMLLVNAYLGTAEAGVYSVVTAIADAMTLLPLVVALNLFPRVARDRTWQPTAEVFRSVAVLYGLFCLATIPFAGPAIRLLFGAEFEDATALYFWLLPGIYAFGMLTILVHHFAGQGMPRAAVWIWLPGLLLNVALNVALLESQGTYIASLASTIGYVVVLALALAVFAREADGLGSLRPRLSETITFVRRALSRG
jgi:O-antigen/teichoic acid export membrane protein